MRRRRFLQIAAASLTLGARAAQAETVWQGIALGADCRVVLSGEVIRAQEALSALPAVLRRIEAEFSLFDPASSLSRHWCGRWRASASMPADRQRSARTIPSSARRG